MRHSFIRVVAALPIFVAAFAHGQTTEPMRPVPATRPTIPPEFTDPETGLRVLHLSRMPADYGSVIYFHYNTFSPDSRLTLVNAQFKDKWRYLYAFDFLAQTVSPLVTDRLTQNQVVHPKSGNLYYYADRAAWVVPLTGGTPRKLADIPERFGPGPGFTVNADETVLLGGAVDNPDKKRDGSNVLYTIDLRTGAFNEVYRADAWLGHLQFSPTDPDVLMFCHEGNWERVDRIWHLRLSTGAATLVHKRSEPREIAGHEFWHPDGKSVWFQHTFRGNPEKGSSLSAIDLATGKLTRYRIPKGFGGIHQSWSPDGSFLISDGSGKGETGPDKYLSILTLPTPPADGSDPVLIGRHLVSLQGNDYTVEPNPHVSPDNRWITFTATLHSPPQIAQAYAVEVPKEFHSRSR